MVKIASQHSWKDSDYHPVCAWSEETTVQWGGRGVVLSKDGSYGTAFFEAFPPKEDGASGFIRGEGKTIEEAERAAFAKYQKEGECEHKHWGRKNYKNGGMFCLKCGAFQSRMPQVHQLGLWREPVKYYETWMYEGELEDGKSPEELSPYARKLYLRSRVCGVTERPEERKDRPFMPLLEEMIDTLAEQMSEEKEEAS